MGDQRMSGTYVKFTDMTAFNAWHAQAMAALGYPNAATQTDAYTCALPGTDGFVYAPVDEHCPPELLEGLETVAGGDDSTNQKINK